MISYIRGIQLPCGYNYHPIPAVSLRRPVQEVIMDIRVLRYFLTVAREGNFSKAATALFISQPTLSRQIADLEAELGHPLLVRGSRRLQLTEEGMLLRKRAEEITKLMDITASEFSQLDTEAAGDVYIGAGESFLFRYLAHAIKQLQENFPSVRFHIFSGNADSIAEQLEKGLVDFALFIGRMDLEPYDFISLTEKDHWGLILRKDHPLARKDHIAPEDLRDIPLIISSRQAVANLLSDWLGFPSSELHIVASFNLPYNATLLVQEGVGSMVSLDKLADTGPGSNLRFLPFFPALEGPVYIAWKKYKIFSRPARLFLNYLQKELHPEK